MGQNLQAESYSGQNYIINYSKPMKFMHPLMYYIMEMNDEPEDMDYISSKLSNNPNITFEIIKSYDIKWDWTLLSSNMNVMGDLMYYNNSLHDNPENNKIYGKMISSISKYNLYWKNLTNIMHMDFISKNMHLNWSYSSLSCREDIDFELVKNNPSKQWDWYLLSKNPTITWDKIINYIELPWDWKAISANPNITYDIIKKYPFCNWDIVKFITENPNMDKEVLLNNIQMFPVELISYVANISIDIIKRIPDLLDWTIISYNMDLDFIMNNMEYKWDWYSISIRPDVTMEFIKNNMELPWEWNAVSENPNLTWKMVFENDKLDWCIYRMSENSFCHHPYFRSEKYKKKLVKYFLQVCGEELRTKKFK
jgi:hypothetical protein